MGRILDVTTSAFASWLRLGAGWYAVAPRRRPEKPLMLYEFEACPFCRKVREALTTFDLGALIYPCPKGGRHREVVREKGGKDQFPFLIDPNTGDQLYESDVIIRHLADTYSEGVVPLPLALGPITNVASTVASFPRPLRGSRARPSKEPAEPLHLYSFEASPYCRLVREVLCELSIPYHLHNVGKNSPSRPAFIERSGKMMVPYLIDPNTGEEMFESADIIRYLEDTYGGR